MWEVTAGLTTRSDHVHAQTCVLFDRYVPEMDPALPYVRPVFAEVAAGADAEGALDVELEASGFQRQHAKVRARGEGGGCGR